MKIRAILSLIFTEIFLCFGEDSKFRIIGGRKASTLEFPYQVEIEQWMLHACGGSIISRTFILTAAHCVKNHEIFEPVPMFILQIRAGSDVAGNGGSLYKARKIIAHEKYVDESKIDEFDIALIKLTEPIQFTDRIKLVNIATEEPSEGERGWVTGYGKQEAARRELPERHLMAIELPVISLKNCRNKLNGVADDMICAGEKKGIKDSCTGDSGGPYVVNNQLAGIVAWGIGCGREGVPGVYTNVAFYKDWIYKKIDENQ